MLLATGWIVLYSYLIEDFVAWYSGSPFERYQFFVGRPFGPNAAVFWLNQILQRRRPAGALVRGGCARARSLLWIVSIFVNIGMWTERFVIVVQSLQREYLPSQWHGYTPTLRRLEPSSRGRAGSSCCSSCSSCASSPSSRWPR